MQMEHRLPQSSGMVWGDEWRAGAWASGPDGGQREAGDRAVCGRRDRPGTLRILRPAAGKRMKYTAAEGRGEENKMKTVIVDAVGEPCPIPVVKATKALRELGEPGTLEVRVDNEIAVQNLTRMAAGNHLPVQAEKKGEHLFVVTMEVAEPVGDAPVEEPALSCVPDARGDLVVAVDSETMGRGSDELGKLLMKSFLFAVSQLPQLPRTILFYNGGAKLTVEGSESLEDLRNMKAQGVEILTCGTCLNFYGLAEKLAVGGVTNMYSIVEALAGAGKVIKP